MSDTNKGERDVPAPPAPDQARSRPVDGPRPAKDGRKVARSPADKMGRPGLIRGYVTK